MRSASLVPPRRCAPRCMRQNDLRQIHYFRGVRRVKAIVLLNLVPGSVQLCCALPAQISNGKSMDGEVNERIFQEHRPPSLCQCDNVAALVCRC